MVVNVTIPSLCRRSSLTEDRFSLMIVAADTGCIFLPTSASQIRGGVASGAMAKADRVRGEGGRGRGRRRQTHRTQRELKKEGGIS